MTTYPTVLEQLLPIPRTLPQAGRLAVNPAERRHAHRGTRDGSIQLVPHGHQGYLAAAELLASGGNPFNVQLVERGLPYHYHHSPWFAALFVRSPPSPPSLFTSADPVGARHAGRRGRNHSPGTNAVRMTDGITRRRCWRCRGC